VTRTDLGDRSALRPADERIGARGDRLVNAERLLPRGAPLVLARPACPSSSARIEKLEHVNTDSCRAETHLPILNPPLDDGFGIDDATRRELPSDPVDVNVQTKRTRARIV